MNVERRKVLVTHHEVLVPIRNGQVTRKDLGDLYFFADEKYEEVHGVKPKYDDSWHVHVNDNELVAVIKERQSLK